MRPSEAIEDDEPVLRKAAKDGAGAAAGDRSGELLPFDLHALIERTTGPLAAAAREKDLAIEIKTGAGLPGAVAGNAAGVGEVLGALLENAVRFTERGEVIASIASRSSGSGRAVVHFEISDTGPGMPPEALEGAATGGLARSRRIVERMDGRMECASSAGLGSTVWFDVPLDLRE